MRFSPGSRFIRVLRAGAWSMGGHLTTYVLRIGSSVIMTRLLVPEMFGIIALASIIQVIIHLLSDIGLHQSVIHNERGEEPEFLDSAWTLQVIRGVLIWGICILVALSLNYAQGWGFVGEGTVYADARVPLVLAAITFSSVIEGFRPTRWFVASRKLQLSRVTIIEIAAQFSSILIMIAIAWYTRSIWSIVFGVLGAAVINVWLTSILIPGVPHRFRWHSESIKALAGYGRWILLSSMLFVISANMDRLMLGAWVAPAILGFYVLALNIANIAIQLCSRLIDSICMPAFSEVARESPERFRSVFLRTRMPFDIASLAAAGALYASSQALVDLMYDDRYADAGAMAAILSFLLIVSRFNVSASAYQALGVPKLVTVLSLVRLVSICTFMPIGYQMFGIEGAIWGIALHSAPTLPFYFAFNSRFGLNNFLYEVGVLIFWPVGFVAGLGLAAALEWIQL